MAAQALSLRALFEQALEFPSPHEQQAFLDQQCAGDAAIRAQVEALLGAYSRAGDFLEAPAADLQGIWGEHPETQASSDTRAVGRGAAPLPLDFLEPPSDAAHLGRLGHYEIWEVVGCGGMGIVLKAFDEKLQRLVAIKVLAPVWAASAAARKRFVREAQSAAAVSHDHLVPIYAVEESGRIPYFVMQYIAGSSLQERIDRHGPLPIDQVLSLGLQIAEGLFAAHRHGLVHRDIKSGNILLEEGDRRQESGVGSQAEAVDVEKAANFLTPVSCLLTPLRVKITDFGLARSVDDNSLSREGMIAGTPDYMAPEQARGEPVDHRADLFSFGCVLYRLLTGELPFKGARPLTSVWSLAVNKPAPPRQLNPQVPPALSDLILRLLAENPSDRPQSAREVADALSAIRIGKSPRRLPRKRRRHVALVAAAALTLLLLAGGYLYAPAIYRLVTNQGQLVVETDDPDVKVVVKQQEQEVLVIDAKTNQEVTLKAGQYEVELSPAKDGLRLLAPVFTLKRGGEQIVRVYFEPRAPQPAGLVHTLEGHENHVNAAAFCLSGTRVISGGGALLDKDGKWIRGTDFALRIWDVKTGREVGQLQDHIDKISCLVVSPDGKRAVSGGGDAGGDFQLRYWNLETRELIRCFDKQHTGRINGMAFTADGTRVWSAGGDKSVRLWNVDTGREVRFFEFAEPLWSVAVSRDQQRVLTGNWRGVTTLWNAENGKPISSFRSASGNVVSLSFSPDERLCLTHGDSSYFGLWDLETGQVGQRFYHQRGWIARLTYSPDGRRILSCGEDRTIYLWDAATGKEICRFEGHTAPVGSVAFSPDGRFAVSASWDKTMRIWKLPE